MDVIWVILVSFLVIIATILLESLMRSLLHRQKSIIADSIPEAGEGFMFVGHSTVIFRLAGTVVLTDPILTSRYLGFNRRFVSLGIQLKDLAKVDIVIISHGHPDHNHPASLSLLARYNKRLTLVVPGGYARKYRYAKKFHFAQVLEVPRYESVNVKNLTIINVPAKHPNSEGASGWILQSEPASATDATGIQTVYFAGDTGYDQSMFREIGVRFTIDLAFLPMGCNRGSMFFDLLKPSFKYVHMGPRDYPMAINDLHARATVPIHWGTFLTGCEPIPVPPADFRELQEEGTIPPTAHLSWHGKWFPMDALAVPAHNRATQVGLLY